MNAGEERTFERSMLLILASAWGPWTKPMYTIPFSLTSSRNRAAPVRNLGSSTLRVASAAFCSVGA